MLAHNSEPLLQGQHLFLINITPKLVLMHSIKYYLSHKLVLLEYYIKYYLSDNCLCWDFYGPVNQLRSCWAQTVYLTTLFSGQALSSKLLTRTCASSITRKLQLPFLNQQKGENDCWKYFMITLHAVLLDPVGINLATSWSAVWHTSDWATKTGSSQTNYYSCTI